MFVAIVVVVYLVALFGACALAQRRQEKIAAAGGKSSALMAGKNLPMILVIALTAGGSIGSATTNGLAQLVQTAGVSAFWYSAANIVGVLFLGIVAAKRIRRLGYSTNNEMIADYCGGSSRFLMVLGQLVITLGVASLQFVSGGAMLASMFPEVISYNMGIVITAVIFTIICLVGGLYGTGLANVINLVAIFVGLGICCIMAVVNAGGMGEIITGINGLTESTTYGGPWLSITGGLGLATCLSYMVSEPGNRITTQANTGPAAAAKSEKAATWGIVIGALCLIPVTVISVIMGLIAKLQFSDINSAQALSAVILSLDPLVAALGMVGLWAVTVSTGIALLMAAVQIFCYDVMAPINMHRSSIGAENKKQMNMNIQSKIVTVVLAAVMLVCALRATSIVGTIILVLCISPAFFWIMLSFLYFPKLIKKHSVLITLIVAYIFFFAWLFIPAVKSAFPTPIYVEWPLCTVVWFLCAALEKEGIGPVVPKSERTILGSGVMKDD